MSNNGLRKTSFDKLERGGKLFIHRGFKDRMDYEPIPPEYDTWPRARQCQYEQGRLIAAHAIAFGIDPKWTRFDQWPKALRPIHETWHTDRPFTPKKGLSLEELSL